MEGLMLVPPERGTIIGRAIWKVCLLWNLPHAAISNQTPSHDMLSLAPVRL